MASRTSDKNRWISEKLDRINLTVPKGQKEIIQAHAQAHGESVNGFINRAIGEATIRDQEKDMMGQHLTSVIAKSGKTTEAVENEELEEAALKILEREVPGIRKIYNDEKQRQLTPDEPGTRIIDLNKHN